MHAMVESETFVSRRKKHIARRGPRKLFTAKGLVDANTFEIDQAPIPSIDTSAKAAPDEKTPKKNKESVSFAVPSSESSQKSASLQFLDVNLFEDDDASSVGDRRQYVRAVSTEEDMQDALPMGCMDTLFFLRRGEKKHSTEKSSTSRDRMARSEFHRKLPVPNKGFMDQLAPTESDIESAMNQMNCKGPTPLDQKFDAALKDARNRLADLPSGAANGPNRGFDPRFSRNMPPEHPQHYTDAGMQQRRQLPSPRMAHGFPSYDIHIESPPSLIFIDEQPCMSDDLIAVDDLPPPTGELDLTRLHPKPLTNRPDYDFGKPLLSMDSEESEGGTAPSGKNPLSPRDQNQKSVTQAHQRNSTQTHSNILTQDKSKGATSIKSPRKAVPTLDSQKFPSFDEGGPSFDEHERVKGKKKEEVAANPTPVKASPGRHSPDSMQISVAPTGSSSGTHSSVATDEAVATEESKIIIKAQESPKQPPLEQRRMSRFVNEDEDEEEELTLQAKGTGSVSGKPLRQQPVGTNVSMASMASTSSSSFFDENRQPHNPSLRGASSDATSKVGNIQHRAKSPRAGIVTRAINSAAASSPSSRLSGSTMMMMTTMKQRPPTPKSNISGAGGGSDHQSRAKTSFSRAAAGEGPHQTVVAKSADYGRRPLDLMVRTNIVPSPKAEEFYSPKTGGTPQNRNSCSSAAAADKRISGRFAFDESFDDSDYFEPAMM